MNKDVMVDLETMGLATNAAIIAIGAMEFSPAEQRLGAGFYMAVSVKSSVELGMQIDLDTMMWWLGQTKEAQKAVTEGVIDLRDALGKFSDYLEGLGGTICPWSNGAGFDIPILETAYKLAGLPIPWSYKNVRCFRTVAAINPHIPREHPIIAHHALHDAAAQAKQMLRCLAPPLLMTEERTIEAHIAPGTVSR